MTNKKVKTNTDLGEVDLPVLSCDFCHREVPVGTQDSNWIQTQQSDSNNAGLNLWGQPHHFDSTDHLIAYYQGATPND